MISSSEHRRDKGPVDGTPVLSTPARLHDRNAAAAGSRVPPPAPPPGTGLRDLGYIEGRNLVIESRWADGQFERLPNFAAELARLNVDIILTAGTPGIRAAKNATTKIPIVMVTSGDPVAFGFVASLGKPGGNVTGSSNFGPELSAKRLELLKDAFPGTQRVGVVFNPENSINDRNLPVMEKSAASLKLTLHKIEVRNIEDLKNLHFALTKQRVDAVVLPDDDFIAANQGRVVEWANAQRLPSIGRADFAQAGGVIGYSVDFLDLYRRSALFVDKIVRGAKPADIPVEQPIRFDFIVNLKAAKMIGVNVSTSILVQAEKVIE